MLEFAIACFIIFFGHTIVERLDTIIEKLCKLVGDDPPEEE